MGINTRTIGHQSYKGRFVPLLSIVWLEPSGGRVTNLEVVDLTGIHHEEVDRRAARNLLERFLDGRFGGGSSYSSSSSSSSSSAASTSWPSAALAPGVGGRLSNAGIEAWFALESSAALTGVAGDEIDASFAAFSATSLFASRSMLSMRIGFMGLRGSTARPFAFSRSSAARNLTSRASNSSTCDTTSCFFSATVASRSAMLFSILNMSSRAAEKDLAIVDCGLRGFGFQSLSSSSSDMLAFVCRRSFLISTKMVWIITAKTEQCDSVGSSRNSRRNADIGDERKQGRRDLNGDKQTRLKG